MITVHPSYLCGRTRIDWLESWHSFSFGNYYDPNNMGFGDLRVINEDKIAPATGFGTHPHRDMEIITYVMEGALQHKDSLGTGSVIVPGDVQRMSAGTGILHSEFNALKDKQVHLLQIWIMPEKNSIVPGYEQKNFMEKRKPNQFTLLVSPDGRNESIVMHQNALMYVLDLDNGEVSYKLLKGRTAWVQVARGEAKLNGMDLKQGDGAAVTKEDALQFSGGKAEIILFDLPE